MLKSLFLGLNTYDVAKSVIIARFMHLHVSQVMTNFAGMDSKFNIMFGIPFVIFTAIALCWAVYHIFLYLRTNRG